MSAITFARELTWESASAAPVGDCGAARAHRIASAMR